jgi:hypothetical protein
MIAKDKINADILVLGDSFALTAFYNKGKVFSSSDKLMSSIVSLATNADVTMAGQYFVLKRYLEKNRPPKMVFLISTPFLWDFTLGKLSDNYFFSFFTNRQEIRDVLFKTKDIYFLIRLLYYKFLPSAQYSLYLAEFRAKSETTRSRMLEYMKDSILMKIGLQPERSLQEKLSEIDRPHPLVVMARASEMIRPFGGEPFAAQTSISKEIKPQEEEKPLGVPNARFLSEIEFREMSKIKHFGIYYFDKICKMLREKGVKLYYVDASATYSLFKEQGGYFISGKNFVKTLQKKTEQFLYLEDFAPLYFSDEYFYDRNHLNSLGARHYLHIFNKSLKNLVKVQKN